MLLLVVTLVFLKSIFATPPACFLSCINEIAHDCPEDAANLTCICINEDLIIGCLVDICPFGTFISARDHYIGTCLEHGRPSITNPIPPPAIWPPEPKVSSISDTTMKTKYTSSAMQVTQTVEFPARVTITPLPSEVINPEPEIVDESEDEFYNPNEPCEWEETDELDENGAFIVIRRPVNVPKRYRDPTNVGNVRRVIITRPVNYYSNQHAFDKFDNPKPRKIQHVKRIKKIPKNISKNANNLKMGSLILNQKIKPKKNKLEEIP